MLIIAFVLPGVLAATRALLGRAGPCLFFASHAAAISVIVLLPSYLATRKAYAWHWVSVAAIAGASGIWFTLHWNSYISITQTYKDPFSVNMCLFIFALMAAAGVLAVTICSSYQKRHWIFLSFELICYLVVLAAAFVLSFLYLYGVT
jgi:hypothetical protein